MIIFTPLLFTFLLPVCLLIFSFFNIKSTKSIASQGLAITSLSAFCFWIYCLYCLANNTQLPFGTLPIIKLSAITFALNFKVDELSIVFGGLSSFLFLIVSLFSKPYLSGDRAEIRFYFLISLLLFALQIIATASSFDALAVGWEIAGISSVFLIGFFLKNTDSLQRSLFAFMNYKIGDVALLTAIGLIHINFGDVSLALKNSSQNGDALFWISLLIILASAAKSSQFPLSSWLKNAVEGPTSSTAIFYGAISIHLGPFLLLRTQSWWESIPSLRFLMILMGLITTVLSTLYARTRNDGKTVLIASSQAQVGLMYVAIALGLNTLAIIHMLGHAGLRTWQLLRASSLIHDFQDNLAIFNWMTSKRFTMKNKKLFILMREGFYIEAILNKVILLLVEKIQKIPNSTSIHIMLTLATVLSSLSVQSWIEEWKLLLLIPSLIISLQAISTKDIYVSIYGALLSQILHIWLGQMTSTNSNSLFLSVLIFEAPLFAMYAYLTSKWLEPFKNKKPTPFYYGLGDHFPHSFAQLSIISILLSGAPIGLTFFFEELAFHNTFESSIGVTLLTLLIAGLNTVVFVKNTFRLFGGSSHVGIIYPTTHRLEKWIIAIIISFYLFTMIYPQPILSYLTKILNLSN